MLRVPIGVRERGAAAALLLIAVVGCRSGPAPTYVVSVAGTDSLLVGLRLSGLAGPSVALADFAYGRELEVVSFAARAEDGTALHVDRAPARGEAPPTRVIRLDGRTTVDVGYTLKPRHEGRGNGRVVRRVGSSVSAERMILRGRELFLLPEPTRAITAVQVAFRLPPGWRACAPWIPDGAESGAVLACADAAEELIGTPVALGRFSARGFRAGATNYRVFLDATLPEASAAEIVRQLAVAATQVGGYFSRRLGPTYTILAPPTAPAGAEIAGDAWGTGQGTTLVPLTTARLRTFARQLAGAYLLQRPHRVEFEQPSEHWIVVGLMELLALRATARARGIDETAVDKYLAYMYATLPEDARPALDLERFSLTDPKATESMRLASGIASSFALRLLERDLGGEERLADHVRRVTGTHTVASFWSGLPEGARDFRRRMLRADSLLPIAADRETSAIAPEPTTALAGPSRPLTLAVTSQTFGYLENCGCKVSQNGGVARRGTVIRDLRAGEPLVVVDAGSSFPDVDRQPEFDAFTEGEQRLFLAAVNRIGYDAAAVGFTELLRGPLAFGSLTRSESPPFVCANVAFRRREVTSATRVVRAGGVTCRLIGIFEPPNPFHRSNRLDQSLDSLEIGEPLQAVRREVESAREGELVIVIGELTYRTIRAIARDVSRVDLIVTSQNRFRGELAPLNPSHSTLNDLSGFLGDTYVAYSDLGEYGLDALRLRVASSGRIASASLDRHELGPQVADDPAIRGMLDQFYRQVSLETAREAHVEAPFDDDPVRHEGGYVGVRVCATCHAAETAQWSTTGHASAYKTLLDAHRNYQPRCVACHVVGYGTPRGFHLGSAANDLANVQCESCHGPGEEHVRAPTAANIQGKVPARVCLECHTPDHSEAFVYESRLPLVAHRPIPAAVAARSR